MCHIANGFNRKDGYLRFTFAQFNLGVQNRVQNMLRFDQNPINFNRFQAARF